MHRIEPQTTLDGHTMPLAAPFDFARSMEQRSLSARSEKRIKGSLGYLSPIEYRESLGLAT